MRAVPSLLLVLALLAPAPALAAHWTLELSDAERRALVAMPDELADLDSQAHIPARDLVPPDDSEQQPTSFSWMDRDGVDWMMPVRNQAQCGSCAAFGITGLLEMRVKQDLGEPDLDIDLSDSHCLTCSGGSCDDGITFAEGLATLMALGLPTEACAPYGQGGALGQVQLTACDEGCDGVDRGRVYLQEVERFVLPEEMSLADQVAVMKKAIAASPLLVRLTVWSDLFQYSGDVYRNADSDPDTALGFHALLLIGWDDTRQAWLVRNSWGADWGNDGYLWLGWGAAESHTLIYQAQATYPHALYDLDRDGRAAEADGGVDCDDFDPAVLPGAEDLPGDGVDADCDGDDGLAGTPDDPAPPDGFFCSAAGAAPPVSVLFLLLAIPLARARRARGSVVGIERLWPAKTSAGT